MSPRRTNAGAQSLILFAMLAAAGCSSSPVDPGGRQIEVSPSFATDINEIFQRRGCSAGTCHGAANGQVGFRLTGDAAGNYAMLVNVDATSESFKRVLPGNADDSYIVIKTEGRQTVGVRMPFGGTPLDNIDQTNLRNWINNGAPNN